ncbi:MAG: hypothetical protein ACOC5T_05455 [Elusimicrobiota bacterium]
MTINIRNILGVLGVFTLIYGVFLGFKGSNFSDIFHFYIVSFMIFIFLFNQTDQEVKKEYWGIGKGIVFFVPLINASIILLLNPENIFIGIGSFLIILLYAVFVFTLATTIIPPFRW